MHRAVSSEVKKPAKIAKTCCEVSGSRVFPILASDIRLPPSFHSKVCNTALPAELKGLIGGVVLILLIRSHLGIP